jgi:two-component system response regulator PilR (NtrC family)
MIHLVNHGAQDSGKTLSAEFRPDGRWIIGFRLTLLWIALLSVSYSTFFTSSEVAGRIGFLFYPLAGLFIFSAASAFILRWYADNQKFLLGQLLVDIAMLTGIVYVTGGPASPFLFLYLPLVMVAAILLSRAHALLLASLGASAYSLLVLGMYEKIIVPADGTGIIHIPVGGFALQCLGLTSAMVLVGVATSFLRRSLYAGFQLAERSAADLSKLGKEQEELKSYVKEIEEQVALQERMAELLSQPDEEREIAFENFVGQTELMQRVFRLIQRVAQSNATVLISGESGTGKELVAQAIHRGSPRIRNPFVAVNCGAIPENLIESELFGHRKGAFTGADSDHTGLFRKAEGGTLFLDEIGELPLLMQAKLLRVIQEKTVRPVGSDVTYPIDVRIVAATNRNLPREVKEGRFREDLFYRLNVIHVQLPALRERREDIPLLVRSIVAKLKGDESEVRITPSALQALVQYDYPGNVRELENIIERALVFGGDVISAEHLPEYMPGRSLRVAKGSPDSEVMNVLDMKPETQIHVVDEIHFPVNLEEILSVIERRYLEQALQESKGVKKRAAELLGINFRSLRYRLQKFDLGAD